MIITVASFKGGVAKTTSAIHLAACLQKKGPTLLIDGDPNRSASGWAKRGNLPFKVIDERQAARKAKNFARSDEIRNQLTEMGIILEDTKDGMRWRRK